jgi:hypothetical protein
MSSLSNIYIKVETLETLLKVVKAKAEKGISIDLSISDEANKYEQNVTAYVSQTKEQREAKKEKFYVGNGKTFWTDGKICVPKKAETHDATPIAKEEEADDLPF